MSTASVSSPIQCSSRDQFFFFFFFYCHSSFCFLLPCSSIIYISYCYSSFQPFCHPINVAARRTLYLKLLCAFQHQYFRQTCHFGNVCCLVKFYKLIFKNSSFEIRNIYHPLRNSMKFGRQVQVHLLHLAVSNVKPHCAGVSILPAKARMPYLWRALSVTYRREDARGRGLGPCEFSGWARLRQVCSLGVARRNEPFTLQGCTNRKMRTSRRSRRLRNKLIQALRGSRGAC